MTPTSYNEKFAILDELAALAEYKAGDTTASYAMNYALRKGNSTDSTGPNWAPKITPVLEKSTGADTSAMSWRVLPNVDENNKVTGYTVYLVNENIDGEATGTALDPVYQLTATKDAATDTYTNTYAESTAAVDATTTVKDRQGKMQTVERIVSYDEANETAIAPVTEDTVATVDTEIQKQENDTAALKAAADADAAAADAQQIVTDDAAQAAQAAQQELTQMTAATETPAEEPAAVTETPAQTESTEESQEQPTEVPAK